MEKENQIRKLIRQVLEEEVNNFLKKEKNTYTRELSDNSKDKDLGSPLETPMNVMDGPTGSDSTSPTVSVKAGATKAGSGFKTGQKKANFSQKTEQA